MEKRNTKGRLLATIAATLLVLTISAVNVSAQDDSASSDSNAADIALVAIFAFLLIVVAMVIFLAQRYRRCPPDKVIVIYGRSGGSSASKTVHGGGILVWPLIQDYAYLDLKPMSIQINLTNALSNQNIRVNVPSTFTVGISVEPNLMQRAAERLLGLTGVEIEELAQEIIFGQLRLTIAMLTIEQINQDRDNFLESIMSNVGKELNKVGLYLINVNITDITDESEYIESIGKKAAAVAVQSARVDVANAERDGSIGEAQANRQREIEVAINTAEAEKGRKSAERDQRVFVKEQESMAVEGENISSASIAGWNATLAEKEAEAERRSEVAKRIAETDIQKAQYLLEQERLRAEEIVREEIAKTQIEIAAEAEAERSRRVARGEADAILLKYEAEAKGVQKVLDAKASGYGKLIESSGGDARAAATLLMVEKIENMVAAQAEAIKNLKIDKITVWDGGNGGAGDGSSSTSNFVSSLVRSLPPIHDVAKMAGVELPEYLGTLSDDSENIEVE
jgi:flotillin